MACHRSPLSHDDVSSHVVALGSALGQDPPLDLGRPNVRFAP